jgi:hypothetical protein
LLFCSGQEPWRTKKVAGTEPGHDQQYVLQSAQSLAGSDLAEFCAVTPPSSSIALMNIIGSQNSIGMTNLLAQILCKQSP